MKLSPNRVFLVPSVFSLNTKGMPYTEKEIRLLVAIQADGRYPKAAKFTTRVCISVKKERKKERMKLLLEGFQYDVTENEYNDYRFYAPIRSKSFGDDFWWEANEKQRLIILDEMRHWDGSSITQKGRSEKVFFHTTDKASADFIQWCGASTGKRATLSTYDRTDEGKPIEYKVYFGEKSHSGVSGKNASIVPTDDGFKYCFVVPSSFLIMRRNGRIFASGNTGKSKIAIDVASCRFYAGKIKKVLVVALFSIKDNWVNEINKHSPLVCSTHVLDTSSAGVKRYHKFLDEGGFQWLIVGVESFSNGSAFDLCQDFIEENMMIIIDECDSIKSHNSIRTERCIALSEIIRYKMIMTGTPIEKGMIDLYSQFQFLNPDIIGIGDYYSFKSRYAIMGGHKDKNIIGYHRTEELMGAVGKYISQVRKRGVLTELPESTYEERVVQLSPEQKVLYAKLKATLKLEYDNNKLSVSSSINLMQRLAEITGGFYSYIDEEAMARDVVGIDDQVKIKYKKEYLKSNPKAKELMAFVDSLPDDEPVIIWAVSKMEVAYLVNLFKDKFGAGSVAEMHGDISREDRTIGLNDFQEYKRRFIIGNQAVGGIGLNMTAASIMVYFSNDFSLRRRIQSEGRIERIGQTRPMLYVDFVCAGTIDKYIVKSLREKSDFSEEVRRAFDSGSIFNLV
jgi:hypothetical protein